QVQQHARAATAVQRGPWAAEPDLQAPTVSPPVPRWQVAMLPAPARRAANRRHPVCRTAPRRRAARPALVVAAAGSAVTRLRTAIHHVHRNDIVTAEAGLCARDFRGPAQSTPRAA